MTGIAPRGFWIAGGGDDSGRREAEADRRPLEDVDLRSAPTDVRRLLAKPTLDAAETASVMIRTARRPGPRPGRRSEWSRPQGEWGCPAGHRWPRRGRGRGSCRRHRDSG